MAAVPSNNDVLTVNDDGSVTGPAHLVIEYGLSDMRRKSSHGFRRSTSMVDVVALLVDGSGSFTGEGPSVRRQMRTVKGQLEAAGYRAALSGADKSAESKSGFSILTVGPAA